jgi:aerobic-type carbon monoxide dehydrogenase small subunit (CoxS/CutS family)
VTNSEESLSFRLDGRAVSVPSQPPRLLADVLTKECGRVGVRISCDQGVCGVCIVLVDGRPTTSCSTFADTVDGCDVTTVQGLGTSRDDASAVQRAFVASSAFQCGTCTPGMVLLAEALLDRTPDPSREEIRAWMSANVCRCTGYRSIEDAVVMAAALRRGATPVERPWRSEDTAKVTGQRFYLMDMALPGCAEAVLLRSPHAHARIVAIDANAARQVPGVLAVVTGEDVSRLACPTYGLWINLSLPLIASDMLAIRLRPLPPAILRRPYVRSG